MFDIAGRYKLHQLTTAPSAYLIICNVASLGMDTEQDNFEEKMEICNLQIMFFTLIGQVNKINCAPTTQKTIDPQLGHQVYFLSRFIAQGTLGQHGRR